MGAISSLGLFGAPASFLNPGRYDGKTISTAFQTAILVFQFDLWRQGYAGAQVQIFKEGTTQPASLYSDVNLTTPVVNPQVLISQTINGQTYGKFQTSIYTPDAYYLVINGQQATGVFYPGIRTLFGEDATDAEAMSANGGIDRTLSDRFSDTINVRDFGNFLEQSGSTSENTATLTAAIGVASSENGGRVYLPAGVFAISAINLPADVILTGQGRDATFLQSSQTGNIVNVTGDHAGLEDLCLDGISLQVGSRGVYALNRKTLRLSEVTIKRFDTGLMCAGGDDHHYYNLFVDNCNTNVQLRGDSDATNTALGGQFTDLTWYGGAVTTSTNFGLRLTYIDQPISALTIRDLDFENNIGTAFSIEGAQALILEDLGFTASTIRHLLTADVVTGTGTQTFNNAQFRACAFTDAEIKLGGAAKDVIFDCCQLSGKLSINANGPTFPILFRDAIEASTVTQTGNTDKISRWESVNNGIFKAQTTSTVTTAVAFKRVLNPGETVHLEVIATGIQENVLTQGSLKKIAAAFNPAAQLSWVSQIVNFTVGKTVTAVPSGASALIQSQTDAGVTGLLNLIRIVGTFANNDVLTDSIGGTATAQGAIVLQNSVIIPPVQLDHYALPNGNGASTWDVDVTTSGQEVRVIVKGVTTGTIDWNVLVRQNMVA